MGPEGSSLREDCGQEVGVIHSNSERYHYEQGNKLALPVFWCIYSHSSLFFKDHAQWTSGQSYKLFQYPGTLFNRAKETQVYFKLLGSLFPALYLSCVALPLSTCEQLHRSWQLKSQPSGHQHLWLSRLLTSQTSVPAAGAFPHPMVILKLFRWNENM